MALVGVAFSFGERSYRVWVNQFWENGEWIDFKRELYYVDYRNLNTRDEFQTYDVEFGWLDDKRVLRRFDEQNRVAESTYQTYRDGHRQTDSIAELAYDTQDRLIERKTRIIDNGEEINFHKFATIYGAHGLYRIEISYYWNGENWASEEQTYILFETSGEIKSLTTKYYENGVWKNLLQTDYNYDEFGRVTLKTTDVWLGGERAPDKREKIDYYDNINGRGDLPKTKIAEFWLEGDWLPDIKEEFEYYDDGLLKRYLSSYDIGDEWILDYEEKYYYDEEKREVEKIAYVYDGETPIEYERRYYDAATSPIEDIENRGIELSIYPQPATEYIIIKIPEALKATLTLANLRGEIVYERTYSTPGTLLRANLPSLAAGAYFALMELDGETFWRMIVIR